MSGPSRASSIRRGSKFCTIWRYWRVQISILKPDSATNHVKHISEKCTGLLRPGPCWAWAGLPQPTPEAFFLQPPPAAKLCFAPVHQFSSDSIWLFWGTSQIKSPPRYPSFYLSVSWKYQNKVKEKLVSAMIVITSRIIWESHFGVILFGKFQEILE